jgi:hypothetical protein
VESLEGRDCPAGPVITSFTATILTGHSVRLSGTVTDPDPASVSISFGGPVGGMAYADANGNFSYTADASGVGAETATPMDGQPMGGDTVTTQITAAASSLTLNVAPGTRNMVTLSGQVTAGAPGGLTVAFNGVVSGTATTNVDGTFQVTLPASGVGQIQATVTDIWGQTAASPPVTVKSNAPVIENFQAAQQPDGTWIFTGTVIDECPSGLTVQLGGIPALMGKTVTVRDDGTFSFTATLMMGEAGTATAMCTDWFGLQSNTDYALVSN